MDRHRRLLGTFALASVVLLGASCEDEDPEPRFSPSPSASTSSVASSPSGPETSASATPAAETAEEFIRRWAQLETEMQNTGDTAAYRAITKPCEPCDRTADLVERFYEAGGYIRTEGRTVKQITALGISQNIQTYRVSVVAAPTEYKESADGEVKTFPGGASEYEVDLQQGPGGWELYHYVEIPS